MLVSVILPCRDEEKSIGLCIKQIQKTLTTNKIKGEIIVSDSSTDNSYKIAKKLDVKIVKHDKEGYGLAIKEGVKAAKGEIIIFADCDGTYDFTEIPRFLEALKDADMVLGTRLKGKIMKGAMPWLHQHIGNPMLTRLMNLFFGSKITDTQSGFRAIRKDKFESLDLKTNGMEFASEMIIKAVKKNFRIKEIPIKYYKRYGSSKLETFRDGWRHLKYISLYKVKQ